jgi:hypothetical protein
MSTNHDPFLRSSDRSIFDDPFLRNSDRLTGHNRPQGDARRRRAARGASRRRAAFKLVVLVGLLLGAVAAAASRQDADASRTRADLRVPAEDAVPARPAPDPPGR